MKQGRSHAIALFIIVSCLLYNLLMSLLANNDINVQVYLRRNLLVSTSFPSTGNEKSPLRSKCEINFVHRMQGALEKK